MKSYSKFQNGNGLEKRVGWGSKVTQSSKLVFATLLTAALSIAAVGLSASPAAALDISAYYIGSCTRVVGIPIHINNERIKLLSVSGKVLDVPRYEVNLVATYPSDVIQVSSIENAQDVDPIRVQTRRDGKHVDLVKGWPVEFSDDKISFLTITGEEFVIDRSSIWAIDRIEGQKRFDLSRSRQDRSVEFQHPQLFSRCPVDSLQKKAQHRVLVPQQLLSEPVTIKREFDRLAKGHQTVEAYETKQQFFSVPYLYKNQTSLILWTQTGSRYGASRFRSNNLTPLVRNELANGPFSYQHEILTGSGPNSESLHEEAQTQAFYRFKADYVHLSVMSDLSALLVGGKRYIWSSEDLANADFRINDVGRISFGLDYGPFSFTIFVPSAANIGAKLNGAFLDESIAFTLFQLSARYPDWRISIATGQGSGVTTTGTSTRLNASYRFGPNSDLQMSFINRKIESQSGALPSSNLFFSTESRTLAAWYEHVIFKRFPVGASVAVEDFSFSGRIGPGGASTTRNANFVKVGVMAGLIF